MADNRDITFRVNVDNRQSQQSLNQVENSIDSLSESMESLETITTAGFSDMEQSIEGASDAYDGLAESTSEATEAQQDLEESSKSANKGFGILKGGAKALGTGLKAIGIGLIVGLLASLWEALQRNQKVMDAVNVVVTSVSIVFNKLVDALVKTWEQVKESTGGFDAMQKVIINLLKVALTPLKLTFLGIKIAVQAAQLAWEKSMFGGKDQDKIAKLTSDLEETKDQIKAAGEAAVEAGKQVINNLGEAVGEVAEFAKVATKNVTETVKEMSLNAIVAQAKVVTEGANNIERLNILLERQMLISQNNAEIQRQLRDEENNSFNDRIAANEALGKILDEQAQAELDLINKKMSIAQAELSINSSNIELQNEILQLENDRLEVQERITGQRSEQLVNQTALEKEQEAERLERAQEDADLLLEIYAITEMEKLNIEKDAQLESVENSTLSEQEKFDAKMQIYNNYEDDLKKKEDEQLAKQKKDSDDLKAHKIKNMQDALSIFSSISSIYSQINSNRLANELSELEEKQARELENFTGTEEEKQELIRQQKNEIAQIEYQQALADKEQKIIDATIQGGLAILASISQLGPIAGPIVGGALVATQLGLIISQDVPPPTTYASGGILSGNSHANGGISTPYGELEGGEGVINKISMSNPSLRNIASAVNTAGGGSDFSTGGAGIIDVRMVNTDEINDKKVYLNTNELSDTQDEIDIIDNESYL